jgi:hypothetical protein
MLKQRVNGGIENEPLVIFISWVRRCLRAAKTAYKGIKGGLESAESYSESAGRRIHELFIRAQPHWYYTPRIFSARTDRVDYIGDYEHYRKIKKLIREQGLQYEFRYFGTARDCSHRVTNELYRAGRLPKITSLHQQEI